MLTFNAFASSSKGNLYLVTNADGQHHLLLEAGLPIKDIRRSLYSEGLTLRDITACLITHEHKDHACSSDRIIKAGVPVYCSMGTEAALGISCNEFEAGKTKSICSFRVKPFRVDHDAAEPFGYLIDDGCDRLLFALDTYDIPYIVPRLNIIAVECNYSDLLIDTSSPYINRLTKNHMSLERLLDFLALQDLSKVREIHLLHLSAGNSDEKGFVDAVRRQTGIMTYAAKE